jgi:hypothetical protein
LLNLFFTDGWQVEAVAQTDDSLVVLVEYQVTSSVEIISMFDLRWLYLEMTVFAHHSLVEGIA